MPRARLEPRRSNKPPPLVFSSFRSFPPFSFFKFCPAPSFQFVFILFCFYKGLYIKN